MVVTAQDGCSHVKLNPYRLLPESLGILPLPITGMRHEVGITSILTPHRLSRHSRKKPADRRLVLFL